MLFFKLSENECKENIRKFYSYFDDSYKFEEFLKTYLEKIGLDEVSGGHGHYVAMPLRYFNSPKTSTNIHPQQEEKKMESENINVVEQQNAAPVANPLDDLNANVEEFRGKLKLLLDESSVLIRKVKEVALQQKQKERDFIQAKRAIERIRMAI